MCVHNDHDILKRIKRKQRLCYGWKVLDKQGYSVYRDNREPYGPGICRAENSTVEYDPAEPTGLHLWRTHKRAKIHIPEIEVIVKVIFNPKDVIAADYEEIAVTKLRITCENWEKAGLPKTKAKTRII